MSRPILGAVALVFALPLFCQAQGTERFLPSGSQIVVQVDAHAKTKAAYDKTACGQMMQGDTGRFLRALWKHTLDSSETAAKEHNFPAQDLALIKDGIKLLEKAIDEGITLGIEVNKVMPPDFRVVVVLPKLGTGQPNLPKLLGDLYEKAQAGVGGNLPIEIKKEQVAGKAVWTLDVPMVSLGWWAQDDDFILTIGTEPTSAYIKAIDAGKTGLAKHETYKKLLDLGDFPTRSRAFVDMPRLAKLAADFSPEAGKVVDELGLNGMGPILSISGYDGLAQRTISETELIGPRKGLLANYYNTKKFTLADLPPMPSDITSFTASNFNMNHLYGSVMTIVDSVAKVYFPEQVDTVKEGIKAIEDVVGVKFSEDVFGAFDDLCVGYASPAEGPLGLGGTMLFKVKEEAKLKKALNTLVNGLPNIPGVDAGVKKRVYRGVEMYELHANGPGNFYVQSFAVYKGYLVYASYPQAIQGFILRMDGQLATWKADDRLLKSLASMPKELTGLSVSDPRPMIETMLAALPPLIALGNGFTQQVPGLQPFDIGLIPHAQDATRHLFPSVGITTDDGKKVRSDLRSSVGW